MSLPKHKRRIRIRRGIRKKLRGTEDRPRLSVFRSNKVIYAQLIDDTKGVTLAAASSVEMTEKPKLNVETSKRVGQLIGEKAVEAGIKRIVFDRGGYLYHGNVKALADGAREKGLEF